MLCAALLFLQPCNCFHIVRFRRKQENGKQYSRFVCVRVCVTFYQQAVLSNSDLRLISSRWHVLVAWQLFLDFLESHIISLSVSNNLHSTSNLRASPVVRSYAVVVV